MCSLPLTRCLLAALFTAFLSSAAVAGSYGTQTFTFADGTTTLGDGTTIGSNNNTAAVRSEALRLTASGIGETLASFKLPELDAGAAIDSLSASFKVRMSANGTPADGWSLNFGNVPAGDGSGEGGFVMPNGLVIAWDTYDNGEDPPSIEVFANGISVANFPRTFSFDTTFRTVVVHWDAQGLDVTYGGVVICSNLATPGFVPAAGDRLAFSARTGGLTEDVFLDDLLVTTTVPQPNQTSGVVISEFVADNDRSLEDEEADSPDWIEIYNGQNTAVNLTGWHLTNSEGAPALWTFPAITMPPLSYRIVYASGKDRRPASGQLHTNFTLQRESGYVALTKPDNSVASAFSYGPQAQDVSYGELGVERTLGYLASPTPGTKNAGLQAAGPPAEEVVWSRSGGLITGPITVSIVAPTTPGAVVRYTTNNTVPGESSAAYATSFAISASTTIRARVFAPGRLPGPVSTRAFLRLDPSLTNYNNSGQPFSSNLPIIVLDSYGVPVDSYTNPGGLRPFRLTHSVVIDTDPSSGRASVTGPIDYEGRGATHVRGESSSGFPQKQYAWELWDDQDRDLDVSILGLPAESDFVLHAPYTDKTLMRNFVIFSTMRSLRPDPSAMRTKLCEVFFNQTRNANVGYGHYRGVYVLVERIKRSSNRIDIAKINQQTTDPKLITGGYIFKKDKESVGNTDINLSSGLNLQAADPEVLNNAQLNYLRTYLNQFEAVLNGPGFADPVNGYAKYIDPLTMIDNQWFVEIAKQIDGYRLSTYFVKDRNGRIRCEPLWDYNLSLFNADYAGGDSPTGWYYSGVGSGDYYWWPRLRQDPNYERMHWDRYWELRRGIFATPAIHGRIDGIASQLLAGSSTPVTNSMPPAAATVENPARRHFRRWPILGTYVWPNPAGYQQRTSYQLEVGAMKTFLSQRLAWIDDQNRVGTVVYRPPNFSHPGGNVAAGSQLTISAYSGTAPAGTTYSTGQIYFTTDGADPRGANGAPAGTLYTEPVVLNASATVKARLYNAGRWSPLTVAGFIVDAEPASALNLVVSELHYDPAAPSPAESSAGFGDNDFEFIELQNIGTANVDLTGVRLEDAVTFEFGGGDPAALTLGPGGRIVVVANAQGFTLRYGTKTGVTIAGAFSGSLNNAGELVTLRAADGTVIRQFSYRGTEPWPEEANGLGYSLVLNNPSSNPNAALGANWRSSAQIGGSPGLANAQPFSGVATADTDADGFSDWYEYGTGSDAGNGSSTGAPEVTVAPFTVDGGTASYLRFQFRRNLSADDVNFMIEVSDDLQNWRTGPSAAVYVDTVNNGDGTATVTYRSAQPICSTYPRMFMRLNVLP